MEDILLFKIVELAGSGWPDGATRPTLAAHLKVKPPRVSTLARALLARRLIRRRNLRLNGTGRRQIAFLPTAQGKAKAAGIAVQLDSLGRTDPGIDDSGARRDGDD